MAGRSLLRKRILLIRHGTTEMNEMMDTWGSAHFQDKMLWDTKLSKQGTELCQQINATITPRHFISNCDLIISSPLTRSLQTASAALAGHHVVAKKIVLPLCTERVYMSSEIGRMRSILENEFASDCWDFSFVSNDEPWWFQSDGTADSEEWRPLGIYAVTGEPRTVFSTRMTLLRKWLNDRQEETITVFTHWAVIYALTGESFNNCQMKEYDLSQFLNEPMME